jgi:hypothetical protein
MVHGRERGAVQTLTERALAAAGAAGLPHATLFCVRRFKQTGGRYFAADEPRALAGQEPGQMPEQMPDQPTNQPANQPAEKTPEQVAA